MSTCNVELTEHHQKFIDSTIADGSFSDASEVVRAGLLLLERQAAEDKEKLEWLRGAVQEGIHSMERGEYTALSSPADIDRFVDEIRAEVLAEEREAHAVA